MTTFGYFGVQSSGPVATARPALQPSSRPSYTSAYADIDNLISGIIAKRRRVNFQQLMHANPDDTHISTCAASSAVADSATSCRWPPNTDGSSHENHESPCYLDILATVQPSLGSCWLVGPTTGREQGIRCIPPQQQQIASSTAHSHCTSTNSHIVALLKPSRSSPEASPIVADCASETTSWTDPPAMSRKRPAESQTVDPVPSSAARSQMLSRQLAAAAAAAAGLPPRSSRQRTSRPQVKAGADGFSGDRSHATTATTGRLGDPVKTDTGSFPLSKCDSRSHAEATKHSTPPPPSKQQLQQQQQGPFHQPQQHQPRQQQPQLAGGWFWNVIPASEQSDADRSKGSWSPAVTDQKPPSSSAAHRPDSAAAATSQEAPCVSALSLLAAAAAAATAACSSQSAAAASTLRPQQSVAVSKSSSTLAASWGRLPVCTTFPSTVAAPSVTTGATTRGSTSGRSHCVGSPLKGASSATGGEESKSSLLMMQMWSQGSQARTPPAPPPRCAVVTTGAATASVASSRSGSAHQPPPPLPKVPATTNAAPAAAGTTITTTTTTIGRPQAQLDAYGPWQLPVQALAGARLLQEKEDVMVSEPYSSDTAAWRVVMQPSASELPSTPIGLGLQLVQSSGYGQQQHLQRPLHQQPSRRQREGQLAAELSPRLERLERSHSQKSAQQPQSPVAKLRSEIRSEQTLSAPFAAFSPPQEPQQQQWCEGKPSQRRQKEVKDAQLHSFMVAGAPANGEEQEIVSRAVVDVSEGQSWQLADIPATPPTRQASPPSPVLPEQPQREPEPCVEPITVPVSTPRQQQLQTQAPTRTATGAGAGATAATANDVIGAITDVIGAIADAKTINVAVPETSVPSEIPAAMSGQPLTEALASSVRGWLPADGASQPALPALERLLAAAAAAAQAAAAAAAAVGDSVVHSTTGQLLLPSELLRVEPAGFLEPSGTLRQGDVLHTACRLIRLGRIRPSIAISLPWSEPTVVATASPSAGPRKGAGPNSNIGGGPGSGAGRGAAGASGGSKLVYGAMENAAAAAAAAGVTPPTAPLFAVLRLLVEFACAARALQLAESRQRVAAESRGASANDVIAASEAYRALWPLMRRGRKYAEMLMAKVERTLTDNDETVADVNVSSPERSYTSSL